MITAIDTSVLVDVLIDDATFAGCSAAALRRGRQEGQLIVCDAVVAELVPVVEDSLAQFFEDLDIAYVATSRKAAMRAGTLFKSYLDRGGRRGRVVADFLIGAHARFHADRLLCRDDGFQGDYCKELEVWDPREDGERA